jgi:diguanylate cyclase (GGDEF)-like protein
MPPSTHPPARPSPARAFRAGLLSAGTLIVLTGLPLWARTRHQQNLLRSRLTQALHDASHDPLTGLPGRDLAMEHIRLHPDALVGLLDVDRFKTINDDFGHQAGDHVLQTLAIRLSRLLARHGLAARWAGDEFLLIWDDPATTVAEATAVLDQALAPIEPNGLNMCLTASLGLAHAGPHLQGASLIRAADLAMYEAKRRRAPHVHLHPGTYPPPPSDRRTAGRTGRRPATDHPPADGPTS